MSLLDQLASYRCTADEFSSQLLFLEEQSTSSFQQLGLKSKFAELHLEDMGEICSGEWKKAEKREGEQKRVVCEWKDKIECIGYQQIYAKMSRFVDLFEAKIRKLKTSNNVQKQLQTAQVCLSQKCNGNNIQSATQCIQEIANSAASIQIRKAFKKKVSFESRLIFAKRIFDFLCDQQKNREGFMKKYTFEALEKFMSKTYEQKVVIKLAQSVNLTKKLKATKIKTFLNQQPYQRQLVGSESSIRLNNPSYPQYRQEQSFDYYDNVALFLPNDTHFFQSVGIDFQGSNASSKICMSVLSLKKGEDSPRSSIIKKLSEFQLHTRNQGSVKRNHSIFTTVSGFITQNGTEYEGKANDFIIQQKLNSEINRVYQHQQKQQKNQKIIQTKNQKSSSLERDFSKESVGFLQNSQNQSNIVNTITNKRFDCQRNNLTQFGNKIEEEFEQKVSNYVEFRKSIEKRRESTLKQIERSKSMIKKLMSEFKKTKESQEKTKILLKQKNSKRSVDSRNSSKSVTKNMSVNKIKTNVNSRQGSVQKRNQHFQVKSIEKGRGEEEQRNSFKAMQVYYNYMKEKKKMNGGLNTSGTKKSQNDSSRGREKCSQHGHLKKPQLPKKSVHNYKNLLSISNFGETKRQRIQLRVDLSKKGGEKDKIKEKDGKKRNGK